MAKMLVGYIAGKFRGKNAWEVAKNIQAAEKASFDVANLAFSYICPHLNGQHFDGTLNDRYWLDATLELMRRCDFVYIYNPDDLLVSEGTIGEQREATRLGIPIFYNLEDLECWANQL